MAETYGFFVHSAEFGAAQEAFELMVQRRGYELIVDLCLARKKGAKQADAGLHSTYVSVTLSTPDEAVTSDQLADDLAEALKFLAKVAAGCTLPLSTAE